MKVRTEQTILIGDRVKVKHGTIYDDAIEEIPEGILSLAKKNSPAVTVIDGTPKPKVASVQPTTMIVEPKMKPAKPEPKKAPVDSKKKKPASEPKKKKLLKKRA